MTARTRLTWTQQNARKASPPPADPGYQEPSNHPAAYPDPDANAYENGDTSSWAEDVHPGPYPNSAPPANPGQQEPQGHPATDPAHYFPAGVSKQARMAAERKAAKCLRIAEKILGKKASTMDLEIQALALMPLPEREVQATLDRMADNYTLTEPRTADDGDADADDVMLAEMEAEEAAKTASLKARQARLQAARKAADDKPTKAPEEAPVEDKPAEDAAKKAARLAHLANYWRRVAEAEKADDKTADDDEEAMLAEMEAEEAAKTAARQASRKTPAAKAPGARKASDMPGTQNDPAHYNYRAEGVLAAEDPEAEAMLAEMEKTEAKKAAAVAARKAIEAAKSVKAEEAPEAEAPKAVDEDPEVKKAMAMLAAARKAAARKAAARKAAARKAADEAPEEAETAKAEETETEEEEADEAADKKASLEGLTAEEAAMLAEMEGADAPEGPTACGEVVLDEPMGDDYGFADDPMQLMDGGLEDPMSDEDMLGIYGSRFAGEEAEAPEAEDKPAEEAPKTAAARTAAARAARTASAKPAAKPAATAAKPAAKPRPQPRTASTGVRQLGQVTAAASHEIDDLSKLWKSDPDVSDVFGR